MSQLSVTNSTEFPPLPGETELPSNLRENLDYAVLLRN